MAKVQTYWWCPACNHGSKNDHRRCVARDFNYDGTAWEAACIKAGAERASRHLLEFTRLSPFWIKKSEEYVVLPPGKYYIGDVHNALSSATRQTLDQGAYVNGTQIYVAGTAHIRAVPGSNGVIYPIETGHIGVITENLCSTTGGLTLHSFPEEVEVTIQEYVLTVRSAGFHLQIDTRVIETLG